MLPCAATALRRPLTRRCRPCVVQEQYRTIILINCGAMEDIRALLELPPNVRVVVIDSHRPIHHSYNTDNTDAVLLHDPLDGTGFDEIPEDAGISDSGAFVTCFAAQGMALSLSFVCYIHQQLLRNCCLLTDSTVSGLHKQIQLVLKSSQSVGRVVLGKLVLTEPQLDCNVTAVIATCVADSDESSDEEDDGHEQPSQRYFACPTRLCTHCCAV